MTGLVLELQRDALNPEMKVSNLLRKSLAISKKLNIIEIEEWINNELNGYPSADKLPNYRIVDGKIEAKNPYLGWIPVHIKDKRMEDIFSKKPIMISIEELELLSNSDNLTQRISFPTEMEQFLMEICKTDFSFALKLSTSSLIGAVSSIRNKIIDWTFELEQQSILGEGMSFSNEEKTKAHQTTYQFTNNIGSMHNSQLQQDSAYATQSLNVTETNTTELKKFVEELKNSMDSLKLAQEQSQELNEHIIILESQAKSAKPNSVIIKESGRTVRNLIEGAMGSTISSGLVAYFHLFQ